MATSKGRGGAASKSASKKSTSGASSRGAAASKGAASKKTATASKGAASKKSAAASKATASKKSAASKGAASKGAKGAVAKKSTATKATASKKSVATKSTSARNGAPSKSAASRGRSTASGNTGRGGGAAASRTSSARAASSGARGRGAKATADPRNDLELILQDLMKDIYYAEKKLTKALGKMAKKATNQQLREAFTTHQGQTDEQITKLERAFESMGGKAKAKKCAAMDGLVEESEEHMQEYEKGAGLDAALIVGAQKVEHYEIAAYGSMRSIAKTLGYSEAARIFEEIREQESDTDELLTQIAESVVNLQAEDETEDVKGGGSGSGGSSSSSNGSRSGSESDSSGDGSSYSGNGDDNDGAGRGISALTDGNDRGEASNTGEAMGY